MGGQRAPCSPCLSRTCLGAHALASELAWASAGFAGHPCNSVRWAPVSTLLTHRRPSSPSDDPARRPRKRTAPAPIEIIGLPYEILAYPSGSDKVVPEACRG